MRFDIKKMKFSDLYKLYLQKAQKKGRTQEEVDIVVCWLSGCSAQQLNAFVSDETVTVEQFIDNMKINQNAHLITGVVCGVRVEEVADAFMQRVRYFDKLIDELAKGKSLEKILRK